MYHRVHSIGSTEQNKFQGTQGTEDKDCTVCFGFCYVCYLQVGMCSTVCKLYIMTVFHSGFPWWLRGYSVCLQCERPGFDPWVGKIPWRRKWQPTPVFLPGKFHGWRSLVGYGPQGPKESDTTERLHFHFSLLTLFPAISYL